MGVGLGLGLGLGLRLGPGRELELGLGSGRVEPSRIESSQVAIGGWIGLHLQGRGWAKPAPCKTRFPSRFPS